MRPGLHFGGLLALALLLPACQSMNPQPQPLVDRDFEAIQDTHDQMMEAVRNNDWPGFVAFLTDDATVLIAGHPATQGREATRSALARLHLQILSQDAEVQVMEGRETLAYLRGHYTRTVRRPGDTEPVLESGNYIWILKQQLDGTWLVSDLAELPDRAPTPAPAAALQQPS